MPAWQNTQSQPVEASGIAYVGGCGVPFKSLEIRTENLTERDELQSPLVNKVDTDKSVGQWCGQPAEQVGLIAKCVPMYYATKLPDI